LPSHFLPIEHFGIWENAINLRSEALNSARTHSFSPTDSGDEPNLEPEVVEYALKDRGPEAIAESKQVLDILLNEESTKYTVETSRPSK